MPTDQQILANERFFHDPMAGEGLLKPPISGTACANIRTALRLLGYEIDRGDQYDDHLVEVIRQFQSDYNHTSHDGMVGPSTRRLLTRALAQKHGPRGFLHMEDPEEQLKKKLQAPFLRDIERKNELIEVNKEHLHILELQAAKFGPANVPPHVQIGVNETKETLANLRRQITEIEGQLKNVLRQLPAHVAGRSNENEALLMEAIEDYKNIPNTTQARGRIDSLLEAEAGKIPVKGLQRILDQAPEDRETAMAVAISLGLPHPSDDHVEAARLLVRLLNNRNYELVRYRAANSITRRAKLTTTSPIARDIMLDGVNARLEKEGGLETEMSVRGALNRAKKALAR
jgi:hypothetical protein